MKNSWIAGLVAFAIAFTSVSVAFEKVSIDKLKCLMNGTGQAKEDKSSDWKDGKVYFCCSNCLKKFDDDKKTYAAKANHQLIASQQVEQKACPFSGGELNKDTAIEVKGAKIAFCCNNCKGKAEKIADDEKIEKLFSEENYEKAKFAKVESK